MADLLSRTATEKASEEEVDLALIQVSDRPSDKWYQKMHNQVLNHPEKFPSWQLRSDKLYKLVRPKKVEIDPRFEWKLVVPKENRHLVYLECHDDPKSGHLGFYKTYHRVLQLYY